METNTVNCPACKSPNVFSESDEMIRCRSCGTNIRIEKKSAEPVDAGEPGIRIPEITNVAPELPAASIAQRFLTYCVDQTVTALIFLSLLMSGGGDMQTTDFRFYVAFITVPLYYTLLEGSNGKTLGKIVAGTRVVDDNGAAIGYSAAFFRTLCRMIPLEVLSIFFHSGRCWHDLITRTTVINER